MSDEPSVVCRPVQKALKKRVSRSETSSGRHTLQNTDPANLRILAHQNSVGMPEAIKSEGEKSAATYDAQFDIQQRMLLPKKSAVTSVDACCVAAFDNILAMTEPMGIRCTCTARMLS